MGKQIEKNRYHDLEECIDSPSDLNNHLRNVGENHRAYKNYTQFPRLLDNILIDKCIYLSDGTTWNDKLDRQYFLSQSKDRKLYGLCFSYEESESVAMWMLYGGLADKGAMISFTNQQINSVIEGCQTIELGRFTKTGRFISRKTLNKDHDDFSMYLQDVLYYEENEKAGTYRVNGVLKRKQSVRKDVLEGANPTLKRMPWAYEKEARLIIEVKKTLIEEGCLFARVKLSDEIRKKVMKRIYCSPKYDISLDVDDYNNYANSGIKINQSKLSGQIDWELK